MTSSSSGKRGSGYDIMANLIVSKKEFEKHIPLSESNMDKIAMYGITVELDGDNVMLEIPANRPDLLSFQGVLRALQTYLGKSSGIKPYKINPPQKNYKVTVESSVKEVRPFTACAIVKSLELNDDKIKQIIDMQEKLHTTFGRNRKRCAIGVYPLESVQLPIRYTALPPDKIRFTPLESSREMSANDILQNHPTGKEYAHLLQNCKAYPVFIDAADQVMSMPPIINSEKTGRVNTSTQDVFIECSGFSLDVVKQALIIIVTSLSDMGGKIFQVDVDYSGKKIKTPDLSTSEIKVSVDEASKLIGVKIVEKDLPALLSKMGYGYSKGKAIIPAWRTDVMHHVDIIEDMAIAYGYDKITPVVPQIPSIAEASGKQKLNSAVSSVLIGLGLTEVSSFHLIREDETKMLKEEPISLENSKTEYKHLRQNLLAPMLRIMSDNKDHEYPQNIFEIGQVFSAKAGKVSEQSELMIASSPSNFTQSRQILDCISFQLGIPLGIHEDDINFLIPGRSASVMLGKEKIGYIGEIHPETLKNWGIKMPLSVISLSMDEIESSLTLH